MKTLKIETLTGYWDKDEIMIHACFQILVNFVKFEWHEGKYETFCGYHDIDKCKKEMISQGYSKKDIKLQISQLVDSNNTTKEIWDLYNWWNKIRPNRDPKMETTWDPKTHLFLADMEDDEMLLRLMKVRGHLWT